MRKSSSKFCLSIVVILVVVVVPLATFGCGNGSSGATTSTTTVGQAQTTTTAIATTGGATTTSVGATSSTTSTTGAPTTTTEAAPTTDTADHTAEFRAQFPSAESFINSSWASLTAAPASHLGAAVDVIGQPSGATVDPDSKYLTWQLSVTATGVKALCRTNIGVNRGLLSGNGWVEVRGTVVGTQAADAGGGPIIYVQSIQTAAAPTTTTTTQPTTTTTAAPTTTTS